MTDDQLLLFKLHPCSRGLTNEEAQEIADAAEIVRCERGDVVCRADEPVNFIYLIVHGRIRLELLDVHGKLVMQRFQTAGGQFGAMAASLGEPTSVNCIAEDPSVLLRIDYVRALELCRKCASFRANYLRMIADSVKQALQNNKAPGTTAACPLRSSIGRDASREQYAGSASCEFGRVALLSSAIGRPRCQECKSSAFPVTSHTKSSGNRLQVCWREVESIFDVDATLSIRKEQRKPSRDVSKSFGA